jgi:glycosyltransferase involved in cell wall biosynthesis
MTPAAPLVSVIIPAYNAGAYINETIDSVLTQTYPHVEIIVVDDGSTDDTVERLKKYGAGIKYIYQANAGVGPDRNTGFDASSGDYIAFLDADDIWQRRSWKRRSRWRPVIPGAG